MKQQAAKHAAASSRVDHSSPAPALPQSKGLVLTADHRSQSFEYWPRPTELELATLAASLARTEKFDPQQLVDSAWNLYWASCRKIQQDHLQVEHRLKQEEEQTSAPWEDAWEPLPKPAGYPVAFEEIERLLLPRLKGRTAERAAVFREYILAELLGQSFVLGPPVRPVSYWEFAPDELDELRNRFRDAIAQRFGKLRSTPFAAEAYARFAASFLAWHGRWVTHRKSQARAANARKGWDKRRQARTHRTGAQPPKQLLKEILLQPSPGHLDRSSAPKKRN